MPKPMMKGCLLPVQVPVRSVIYSYYSRMRVEGVKEGETAGRTANVWHIPLVFLHTIPDKIRLYIKRRLPMLNYLWSSMILAGTLWAAVHGRLDDVTQGALTAAKEAVALCVTMLGVMSLWTGVLEIGNSAGLIGQLSKAMRPVLRFLFPDLAPDSRAAEHISVNFIANMLGLGWADHASGLKGHGGTEKNGGIPLCHGYLAILFPDAFNA